MPRRGRANIGRRTVNARKVRDHEANAEALITLISNANQDKIYAEEFKKALVSSNYKICTNCSRLELISSSSPHTCSACKKNMIKFTQSNNMRPSEQPHELKELTVVEQMLISRVHCVMKVYQVKACGSNGQYHYTGNVINVEQDVTSIAHSLPLAPSDLGIVLVRRAGVIGYKDFRVRKQKVLIALQWLKTNNPFYADVEIDSRSINDLPIDGDISDRMRYLQDGGVCDDAIENDNIEESAVPMAPRQSQETTIQTSLNWPNAREDPINEFRHAGYISMAFPHLIPDGKADFLDFSRNIKVTYREWSEYLMRFSDKRFAQDPRFRFHCLNTIQRHDACRQSFIFAKKSDFTGNVQQLSETLRRDPTFIKRLLTWGSKIRGTSPYWFQRRMELEAMVNQLGVPTIFLTLSAADLWWPCLVKHFSLSSEQLESLSKRQRSNLMQKALSENPLVADEYFSMRVNEFMKILKKKFSITDFWYRFEYQHRGSPHVHAIVWLEDAPDVRRFDLASQQELDQYIQFYDSIVSAINPVINEPPAERHPSSEWMTNFDSIMPIPSRSF